MSPKSPSSAVGVSGSATATEAASMRAIVQHGYGSADVLSLERVPVPTVGADEVLLRVHAAGVDRGAWHLMTGRPYVLRLVVGVRTPRQSVLGREVAGTVIAVGSGVTRFATGDEVYGIGTGSFAEYTVARESKLARKPANLSFAQAAAVGVSALTALQALIDVGRVESGHKVLITGASGGVGSYAVQLAKAFGAKVTGVCSGPKADLVRALGADDVIDYTRGDFADGAHRYDLIIDLAGNATLRRLRRALTPAGTAVIAGGEDSGKLVGMNRQLRALAVSPLLRQRLTTVLCKERSSDLERLTDLIETGAVTPSIDRTYSLEQVPDALRYLDAGNARGKLAITI